MSEMNSLTLNGQKYDCFVDGVARSMASWSAVIGSAAGEPIAVSDASNYNLQGLRIFGKTTQDGTPTPDAPVELVSVVNPVMGLYGKNLFTVYSDSTKKENGITFSVNGNGSIAISGTATASAQFNMFALYELPPAIRPGVTYIVSGATSVASIHIYELQDNWVRITDTTNETTFVLSNNAKGVLIRYVIQPNVSVGNITVYPMLRLASVADNTYEQGKPAQTAIFTRTLHGVPVTYGGNYTDANGQQWICNEIDFDRGMYVKRVDVLALDAGSTRWKDGIFSAGDSHYIFLDDPSVVIDKGSLFTHGTYELNGIWANDKYCSSGAGYFQVVTDLTLDEWRAYLTEQKDGGTPVLLLYALQNFEETPLSEEELAAYADLHTYKDHTTVSNDAGAYMELEYVMDAKKYIDGYISAGILAATVE